MFRLPWAGVAAILPAALLCTTLRAIAQNPGHDGDVPRVLIQDSVELIPILNGKYVPEWWLAPSYHYMMTYHPTSRTEFLFSECKKNGRLIKLLSWNYGSIVSAPAELMSYNSRTINFQVRAGDTLSFYREMKWYNPATNRQDTNNYYALDTLEMVTYLVDAGHGTPLAQLDSIGLLPRTTPGMPVIYGTRPVMALVSYVVPSALDGDSVMIGITMKARGSGAEHYLRHDGITFGVSERLKHAWAQIYLSAISPMYAKRSADELMNISGDEGAVLRTSGVTGSPRDIRIRFNGPGGGGQTSLAVHDETGALLFSPYISRTDATESEVAYRAPGSGAYFITLAHNGRIVRTNKIIITE